jgi:2-polyprenyl-3-methyl-5-hydroxy-6-metoxy-1,4-benzoquinol methylase
MRSEDYNDFPCDLCGSEDAVELPHAREITGQLIHICTTCGFVFVRRRRSAERIAEVWSEEIFGAGYSAAIPAVVARLTYVAETVDREIGLAGKAVCEIGAGEGVFLGIVRGNRHGVGDSFGIEPSRSNCELLAASGIECFNGTIEAYLQSPGARRGGFDLVAILWTLENCQDLRSMLGGAHELLRDGGHVVVATGSRILVPFKKSLHAYLGRNPADTHAFRFSDSTLRGALAVSRFAPVYVNRFLDHDVLSVIGKKSDREQPWSGDDYLTVYTFFERWYADSALYFPEPPSASE